MKLHHVAAAIMALATTAAGANSAALFQQFKGKMKEGMYDYKMEMEMPGMPAGMGKQAHAFQRCLTAKDIEQGGAMARSGKEGGMPENCEVKDFNMSGNTASYKMVCKADAKTNMPAMTSDNKVSFADGGYKMDMKMAMDQGGQKMTMNQKMEAKYLGPCK